tara:strand:- start:187 stop:708 length:522 start_codon:yes stop_codon:yes gene_type:complete
MSLGPTNFKIVRGLLTGELLSFLGMYAFNQATLPNVIPTIETHGFVDDQIPNTPGWHDDSAMRNLLFYLLPDAKENFGLDIMPTYSYLRVYKNGDELKKHTDRDACEYSISITLRRNTEDNVWPLFLETDKVYSAILEEGDGLFYKGIENAHWREKFEGERLAQVFLHYVRRQ